MDKIIAALDGLQYSESTRDYAIALAHHSKAHLVGVFLDDPTYTSYKIYEMVEQGGISEDKIRHLETNDKNTRAKAADDFEKTCQQAAIDYSLHHDRKIAIQELKHESIYADLMVIDAKETLSHYEEKIPTRFIRELLGDVQCPVLLTPRKYKPIEKVVLLFDGEPSSVHAIKMFSYVLPEFRKLPTSIISVNPPNSSLHLKDNKLMKEFMKRHYPNAVFNVLQGLPETEIIHHLKEEKENTLVVLGAYRRGTVSRWFRESMADTLMRELKLPLFIAHNK